MGRTPRAALAVVRAKGGDDSLCRLEAHRRALDAVSELPEPYRSTVVNCFMNGLAPEVVARRHALRIMEGRFRRRPDA